MNVTITLFQIDTDRFSALAVDVDQPRSVWNAVYTSRASLIQHLDSTGVVTPAEIEELKRPSTFAQGAQVFHAASTPIDLEKAGFVRYRAPPQP